MNTIRIEQPWATLVCSRLLSYFVIDCETRPTPGRYYVHCLEPKQSTFIPFEVMQELINQSMYGNIDLENIPINHVIGCVEIGEVTQMAKNRFLCNVELARNFFADSVFPKQLSVWDGVISVPLCNKIFDELYRDNVLKFELTEKVRKEVLYDIWELKNLKYIVCCNGEQKKMFQIESACIKTRDIKCDYNISLSYPFSPFWHSLEVKLGKEIYPETMNGLQLIL